MGSPSHPSHMTPYPRALTHLLLKLPPPSTGPAFFKDPEGGLISASLCRCDQRSLPDSHGMMRASGSTCSAPTDTGSWLGGLLPGTARSWPQPRSSPGVCAMALPPGWCGWPSFTQSYVSLSQLELGAVHCGLFLSCNTSQQRGQCTTAGREGCLNICYLNFLCLRTQKPHPPGTPGSAFHIPD